MPGTALNAAEAWRQLEPIREGGQINDELHWEWPKEKGAGIQGPEAEVSKVFICTGEAVMGFPGKNLDSLRNNKALGVAACLGNWRALGMARVPEAMFGKWWEIGLSMDYGQIIFDAKKIVREWENHTCHLENFKEGGLCWDNPQTFKIYSRK